MAIMSRFPWVRRFIPEVKEAPFLPAPPCPVDVPARSVKHTHPSRNVGAGKDGLYTGG